MLPLQIEDEKTRNRRPIYLLRTTFPKDEQFETLCPPFRSTFSVLWYWRGAMVCRKICRSEYFGPFRTISTPSRYDIYKDTSLTSRHFERSNQTGETGVKGTFYSG